MQDKNNSIEQFTELLIKIIEPSSEEEQEELKHSVDMYGTEIFNNLDYVDLPVEQLDKLNALRILIMAPDCYFK